jgi:hypothetical protein
MAERPKLASELAKSRLNRVSQMGISGLAASTIGLVLLGCVGLGYFAGAWLDKRYGTAFWVPTLTFLGMAAGFREMFVTLKRLSASSKWPAAPTSDDTIGATTTRKTAAAKAGATHAEMRHVDSGQAGQHETITNAATEQRPRIFHVPPPPLPEFGSQTSDATKDVEHADDAEQHEGEPAASVANETERLIEELLNENESRRNE